jgi:hypothetical protein
MLARIMLVIGKYSFRFGRSITRSPGSRPNGSWLIQGHKRPVTRTAMPMTISARCTTAESPWDCWN